MLRINFISITQNLKKYAEQLRICTKDPLSNFLKGLLNFKQILDSLSQNFYIYADFLYKFFEILGKTAIPSEFERGKENEDQYFRLVRGR